MAYISLSKRNLKKIPVFRHPKRVKDLDLSDNLIKNFLGLPDFPNIETLKMNNTSLNTFNGAPILPTLKEFSCLNTPIANNEYFIPMVILAFGDSVEKINGRKVTKKNRELAASVHDLLYQYLISGWVMTTKCPLHILHPESNVRKTLYWKIPKPTPVTNIQPTNLQQAPVSPGTIQNETLSTDQTALNNDQIQQDESPPPTPPPTDPNDQIEKRKRKQRNVAPPPIEQNHEPPQTVPEIQETDVVAPITPQKTVYDHDSLLASLKKEIKRLKLIVDHNHVDDLKSQLSSMAIKSVKFLLKPKPATVEPPSDNGRDVDGEDAADAETILRSLKAAVKQLKSHEIVSKLHKIEDKVKTAPPPTARQTARKRVRKGQEPVTFTIYQIMMKEVRRLQRCFKDIDSMFVLISQVS